jgi:hypothetical protein
MTQGHMAGYVGRQMWLSCPMFLLSEFGYLVLKHQHLLFLIWLYLSEMLHFYACSENYSINLATNENFYNIIV